MRLCVKRAVGVCLSAAFSLFLCGCQLIDLSVEPRSYQVNLGSQNVREELILLNVVRASRFEPLNFTALSKYTASGSLGLNASAQRNIGVDFAAFKPVGASAATVSPVVGQTPQNQLAAGGSASTGQSFDLVPLDNQEFYATFLQVLTPDKINLLVNAGLSREVVFYSLVKSIDVKMSGSGRNLVGGYTRLRYNNEPLNDTWYQADGKAAFEHCREAAQDDLNVKKGYHSRWAPFTTNFWYGPHLRDCNYHKFLLLMNAAFQYGVTTAAVDKPKKQEMLKVNQINVTVRATSSSRDVDGERQPPKDVVLCFDPAIAANYGIKLDSKSTCANSEPKGPLLTGLGDYDESMEPVLRSAYGVFQYYGTLVRNDIKVDTPLASHSTGDFHLFNVAQRGESGCFVFVTYEGRSYCVPAEGAGNTKEVLTLLIALVNLSTSRNSLPVTSSVLVNP